MPSDTSRRRSTRASDVEDQRYSSKESVKNRSSSSSSGPSAKYGDNTRFSYSTRRTRGRIRDPRFVIGSILVAAVVVGTVVAIYFSTAQTADTRPGVPSTAATSAPGTTNATPGSAPTPLPVISEQAWIRSRGYCGRPVDRPSLARIVGGTEALKHTWPWTIGLVRYKGYDRNTRTVESICGGTLIGPKFVITATHCFLNSRRDAIRSDIHTYRVLVGGHVVAEESGGAKFLEIDDVKHHPRNNLVSFSRTRAVPVHDISIIILKTDVDPTASSPKANFACLPRPGVIPPVGKKCWTSGWGKTHGTGYDKTLKQLVQPITSDYECQRRYGTGRISRQHHLCAGPYKGNEGTCQGDSGGPLVCQYDDGTWVLHGDTSFGPKPCGTSPSVWVQLSYQLDWICCILKNFSICREIECQWEPNEL